MYIDVCTSVVSFTFFKFMYELKHMHGKKVLVRVIGAMINGIADCDETYNYWEPLHYLVYDFGHQTWEYSPEYTLRSYAYLLPHALMVKIFSL